MTIQYLVVSRTNIISSSKHQFRVPCNVSLYVNLGADFMRFTISILTLSRKRPGYCLTRFNCNLLQIMRESYKKKKKEFRPGANEIFVMLIANSNYTINQTTSFFTSYVCYINMNIRELMRTFLSSVFPFSIFFLFFFFWTRINRARINSNRSAICHVDVSRQQKLDNSTICIKYSKVNN